MASFWTLCSHVNIQPNVFFFLHHLRIFTARNQLYSASRCQCTDGLQSCTTGGTAARVTRARLGVITLEPLDGRRVRLISPDHIPLADWAINENVVIPQSAVCLLRERARPHGAPTSEFLSSPRTSLTPLVSRWGAAAVIQQHTKPAVYLEQRSGPCGDIEKRYPQPPKIKVTQGSIEGRAKIANQD